MINIKIGSKTNIAKSAVSFVITGGVSKIVSAVAANNTDPQTKYQEIEIQSASLVLGAVVAMRCKEYTDKCIDDVVNAFQQKSVEPVLTVVKD